MRFLSRELQTFKSRNTFAKVCGQNNVFRILAIEFRFLAVDAHAGQVVLELCTCVYIDGKGDLHIVGCTFLKIGGTCIFNELTVFVPGDGFDLAAVGDVVDVACLISEISIRQRTVDIKVHFINDNVRINFTIRQRHSIAFDDLNTLSVDTLVGNTEGTHITFVHFENGIMKKNGVDIVSSAVPFNAGNNKPFICCYIKGAGRYR